LHVASYLRAEVLVAAILTGQDNDKFNALLLIAHLAEETQLAESGVSGLGLKNL